MRRTIVIASALYATLSGCGNTGEENLSANLDRARVQESFAALYEEVFAPHDCVTCHDAEGAGGLAMGTVEQAYEQLVEVAAGGRKCGSVGTLRVAPGNADESLLVHKLEGHDDAEQPVCGTPMPIKTTLDDSELARVRAWIDQGAINN